MKNLPRLETLNRWLVYDSQGGTLTWLRTHNGKAVAGSTANRWRAGSGMRVRLNGIEHQMARLCWKMAHGINPVHRIYFLDGDHRNHRIENLIDAGCAPAKRDTKYKNNTSGFRGVYLDTRCGKYDVKISVDGKKIHVGRYDTIEQANAVAIDYRAELLIG